jgi:hypothetical protein
MPILNPGSILESLVPRVRDQRLYLVVSFALLPSAHEDKGAAMDRRVIPINNCHSRGCWSFCEPHTGASV